MVIWQFVKWLGCGLYREEEMWFRKRESFSPQPRSKSILKLPIPNETSIIICHDHGIWIIMEWSWIIELIEFWNPRFCIRVLDSPLESHLDLILKAEIMKSWRNQNNLKHTANVLATGVSNHYHYAISHVRQSLYHEALIFRQKFQFSNFGAL